MMADLVGNRRVAWAACPPLFSNGHAPGKGGQAARGIRRAYCTARPARLPAALAVALAVWLVAGLAGAALAGGGPENVLLVVNSRSQASLTIANHYAALRRIPAANVLYLPWDPGVEIADVDTFRREILRPVIKAVRSRSPACQIDYVVYSSDFPWGIGLDTDVKKYLAQAESGKLAADKRISRDDLPEVPRDEHDPDREDPKHRHGPSDWPRFLTKRGSLNGLTYLWQPVLEENAGYMGLDTNWYFRRPSPENLEVASLAFSSSDHFGSRGELVDNAGRAYLLSTVLGITAGRGNTVEEVLAYLRRSAAADGTHPPGTIYYAKNGNIRSRTRDWAFEAARRQLESLGVAAKIVDGILPDGKNDVQGAMIGTAKFDWKASGSTILPGAICEHLTSSGGVMRSGAGQTPLSEFLRYGAAGASGTVIEPYALQAKFPLASIHVHYARGCTLAEAFYQSVRAPYQLLIVGDPLCRPWADIPQVRVQGTEAGAVVKGVLTLSPTATVAGDAGIEQLDLFVDGVRRARCTPRESLKLDTANLPDGYHELRVVATAGGPICSQGRWIAAIMTANHGRSIEVKATPSSRIIAGRPLAIDVKAPGSIGVAVLQDTRLLARINGAEGRLEIDSARLGEGPVRLRVFGFGGHGPASDVVAAPIELTVVADPSEANQPSDTADLPSS